MNVSSIKEIEWTMITFSDLNFYYKHQFEKEEVTFEIFSARSNSIAMFALAKSSCPL